MTITSASNPRVRRIRALRTRKARDASGLAFTEGIRIVAEAAETGWPVEEVVVAPELLRSPLGQEVVERLRAGGATVVEVSVPVFHSLSGKEGPQGLGAVIRQRWADLDALRPADLPLLVALDRVQDPGNLGTVIRTADAAGASGVLLLGRTTDPYDPAALRASMGALFDVPLIRSDVEGLERWKREGATVVGTSDRGAEPYDQTAYRAPLVLLMGSEAQGLPPSLLALCDHVAAIPMHGRSDSLNLAVATGVMLYEIDRRLRPGMEGGPGIAGP